MTLYCNLEQDMSALSRQYDVLIVGSGAAGLTVARELSNASSDGRRLRIAIIESGGLEETPATEALNQVEVRGSLRRSDVQEARVRQNKHQSEIWSSEVQGYGVRCRVFGGSTARWAGKVAAFDPIDYEHRPEIPDTGWPINQRDLAPYIDRATKVLGLGPPLQDDDFWSAAQRSEPLAFKNLDGLRTFFWQFARSPHVLTDVMRFGPEFQREDHDNITVLYHATAARILIEHGQTTGVEIVSSLTGRNRGQLLCGLVVLAAGAIENARLMLLSKELDDLPIGHYLIDHARVTIGEFTQESMDAAANILGFYGVQTTSGTHMYACGLTLSPDRQLQKHMPSMACFANIHVASDDPLRAALRIITRKSTTPWKDCLLVFRNFGFVLSAIGRKLIERNKIPKPLARVAVDLATRWNANAVARDYVGQGRGRKLERVALSVISEQFPDKENRVTLSESTDRLGLPIACVRWEVSDSILRQIVYFSHLVRDNLSHAGIKGFCLAPAFEASDPKALLALDTAHSSGTTRMGVDPSTSVVDPSLKVHGVSGLYVVGSSIFPTCGHANPTLMIVALAIRLADHLAGSKNR